MSEATATVAGMNDRERILLDTGPSKAGAHRLQAVLTCPTLYSLTRRQPRTGRPAVETSREPLIRGTIGHVGLAHHYARLGAEQEGSDPNVYYEPSEAIGLVGPKHGDLGEKWARLMPAVYREYAGRYAAESLKVKAVEYAVEMQVPVPDEVRQRDPTHPASYLFTQRWDLVVEDLGGRLWIYDHKFVSKIESKTFERYALSMQFVSMAWLGPRIFGPKFGGIRLNVIGVGDGLNPQNTTYARASPPPAPDAVRRFPTTQAHAEKIIRDNADRDPWDWPRTFSETVCFNAYGACDALDFCRYGAVTPHS